MRDSLREDEDEDDDHRGQLGAARGRLGHKFFNPWRRRRSVFVELVEGAREGGSGGGKRVRGTKVRLQGRLGGSGGAH